MAFNSRKKGSVPNVRRAMKDGATGRRERAVRNAARSHGTVATRLARANGKRGLR